MKTKLLLLLLITTSFVNAQITNGIVQEFNFNGNMTSVSGTASFANVVGTFGEDRNGNPNAAFVANVNEAPFATITGLPVGQSSRTIAFWIKPTNPSVNNVIFSYGFESSTSAYGGSLNATNIYQFTYAGNISFTTTNVNNVWKHVVMTYESIGAVGKIFVNGALVTNSTLPLNTFSTTQFFLGSQFANSSPFYGSIDDLKIYSRAINAAEVLELYNGTPSNSSTQVAEYTFDNTRVNIAGTEAFSTANTSFTTNRNNIANTAMSISASNTGTSATITGLPVGNSSRTISFWYKVSANVANSSIFSYGTAATNQTFGMYIQSTGRPTFQAFGTDQIFGTGSYAANTWHHAVLTYDATNVRIYMNGVLTDTKPFSLSTGSSAFKFGNNSSIVSVDDLKIYNNALSQADITSLFQNNTLTSQNFNQNNLEVSLYPNPAKDVLNIEMKNDVKSIEIYNIQGQKVKSSNQKQINVSDLTSGMYLVKIQDLGNSVFTKKFMKE